MDEHEKYLAATVALLEGWYGILQQAVNAQRPAVQEIVRTMEAATIDLLADEQRRQLQPFDRTAWLMGMADLALQQAATSAAEYLVQYRLAIEAARTPAPGGYDH